MEAPTGRLLTSVRLCSAPPTRWHSQGVPVFQGETTLNQLEVICKLLDMPTEAVRRVHTSPKRTCRSRW